MTQQIHDLAILLVAWGAFLRVAFVMLGSLRTFRDRRRFVRFHVGWAEIAAIPEPFLLVATTYALHVHRPAVVAASVPAAAAAAAGAALVLASWVVTIWALLSWPSMFVGHGVVEGHRLTTGGAYGFVRHPIYLGVVLCWLGLAVAFTSPVAFLVTILYVVPSYLFYMRAEEAMMAGAFGDAYRAYRRAVPFLLPRLGRGRAEAASPP